MLNRNGFGLVTAVTAATVAGCLSFSLFDSGCDFNNSPDASIDAGTDMSSTDTSKQYDLSDCQDGYYKHADFCYPLPWWFNKDMSDGN